LEHHTSLQSRLERATSLNAHIEKAIKGLEATVIDLDQFDRFADLLGLEHYQRQNVTETRTSPSTEKLHRVPVKRLRAGGVPSDYGRFYTDRLKDLVRSHYREDFELFERYGLKYDIEA
jgi:hypothetical protein